MAASHTRTPPGEADAKEVLSRKAARADHRAAGPGALAGVVQERRVRKVLKMIESQPCCSVRELALQVRLTPDHLQRLFKQETGVHVRDLIVEHRLQNAAHLLSSSDLSIKEIAHTVGYEHHSSFVRAFHRRFDQSPRRYRQYHPADLDYPGLAERAPAD